jgi:hypothetical protein
MIEDTPETSTAAEKFDFSAFPRDTLFYDRREAERRGKAATRPEPEAEPEAETEASPDAAAPRVVKERRAKKERRRRIDPTTFEKQYTDDELEFMNAMQRFKVQTGKSFPSHGEVLGVAFSLGYRQVVDDDDADDVADDGGIDQHADHNVFQDQH